MRTGFCASRRARFDVGVAPPERKKHPRNFAFGEYISPSPLVSKLPDALRADMRTGFCASRGARFDVGVAPPTQKSTSEFRLRRIFARLAAYERARRALRRRMRTGFCALRRARFDEGVASPTNEKSNPVGLLRSLEAPPGIEPGIEVLQTFALPLGHSALFFY